MKRARWTGSGLTSDSDGTIALSIQVRRCWRRRSKLVRLELPLNDAAAIQAQLDKILNGGWHKAHGIRPDGWANELHEQTARYRGEP